MSIMATVDTRDRAGVGWGGGLRSARAMTPLLTISCIHQGPTVLLRSGVPHIGKYLEYLLFVGILDNR